MKKFLLSLLVLTFASIASAQAIIVPSPIPTLTNNCLLQWTTTPTPTWVCTAVSSIQPLTSATAIVKDATDITKLLKFTVSAISTGTTRTVTWPDSDVTIPAGTIANFPGSGLPISAGTSWATSVANGTGWLHNNGSGSYAWSTPTYTDVGADVSGAAAAVTPTTLGLVIGTNTQAYNVKLTSIAALANAVGWLHNDGSGNFVYSSPSSSSNFSAGIAIDGATAGTHGVQFATAGATPSSTSHNLYSPDGTTLYFNGTALATGSTATAIAITNDTTTNSTMYPTWVNASTGNLAMYVSSTKVTFNPSTGLLTSTGLSDTTGTLASVRAGASSITSLVTGDVIVATSSSQLGRVAVGASGNVLASNGTAFSSTNPVTLSSTVTLTDGATPALDASLGNVFRLSAGGNRTIAVPTNPTSGQRIIIEHYASGGARTLSLNTGTNGFRFGADVTALTSTASGKTDYIGAIWNPTDSKWDVIAVVKGY